MITRRIMENRPAFSENAARFMGSHIRARRRALPLLGEGEAQVEAGDSGGEGERLDREAAQGQRDPRRAVPRIL